RGTRSDTLVESIDLAPTFVEYFGGTVRSNILEGTSLLPLLHDSASIDREIVISEFDYSQRMLREDLGQKTGECMLTMAFDGRWKLVFAEGFDPMLYDLQADPGEFHDLAGVPEHADQVARLSAEIFRWARRQHNRVTITNEQMEARTGDEVKKGILLGIRDQAHYDEVMKDKD
ncbi:MAG: sulfatase/phosphatase domain-containing protein, partial [Pseudomonadota bacterium]